MKDTVFEAQMFLQFREAVLSKFHGVPFDV